MGDPTTDDPFAGLPEGYTARPPTEDDFDAVFAVIVADEAAVDGGSDTSDEDLRGDWDRPSFDLATQAVVIEHAGQVVAYAEQVHQRTYAHVAPDHHGRGLGGALLSWAESSARAQGHPHTGQTVFDGNRGAVSLMQANGYRFRWSTWVLGIDLDGDLPPVPDLRPGYRHRDLDKPRDAAEVYEVIEEAFDTWTDRDPSWPLEDWRAGFFDRGDVTPATTHLVEDDEGRLVAVLIGVIEDGVGVVDQLGVRPALHGTGLGIHLLRRSFHAFAAEGAHRVVLSTESRGSARPFYEKAGMTLEKSYTRFIKEV